MFDKTNGQVPPRCRDNVDTFPRYRIAAEDVKGFDHTRHDKHGGCTGMRLV